MESYDREKGSLEDHTHSAGNSSHHKQRVHLTGKASLQHWFDATLAWKCPRNCLTQPCHEFGQGSCGTSESKSDSWADDGPAVLRNSKRDTVAVVWLDRLVITNMWSRLGREERGRESGGSSRWDGRESGWMVQGGQVQSQLLEQCCRIFYESMLSCEDKTCPAGYSCIFCSRMPSFLMCGLSLIMLSAPNSDKHRMETEQLQFKSDWTLVLDFQLCVLWLVRWVRSGDYHPWNVRLNVCPAVLIWTMWTMRCQTFGLHGFFCHGTCVETKIEEKAWRPLWTTYPKLRTLSMNGFAVLANKCAEENANVPRQLVVHSPVRMRLGRVSWLERGSTANEVTVFNTMYN